jgi:hypothetical protein
MKRLFWRLAPEVVLVSFLGVSAGGCDPKNDVKAGPPELKDFSVIDNATGMPAELTGDAGPVEISGYVHLHALFDRLLDPTLLSDADGGAEDLDLTIVTVTPALPDGTVTYKSSYTPNGGPMYLDPPKNTVSGGLFYGPGPAIDTVADPIFPSASTITVALDPAKIRSKKGEAFTGEGQLMFRTLPFAAAISVPMGDAGADAGTDAGLPPVMAAMQPVTISFTNVPVAADIPAHIHVTAGGAPFTTVTVAPDMQNPTVFTVTPNTTWPANSTIQVTVDATAADALGSTTGAAASESFTTGST